MRNVCLRRLKKGREVLVAELPRYVEKESLELSPQAAIDRLALREWVWAALFELPEALRATAMLRYFGSYSSYEEISATLGVPVGTVRSRLNQVKVKLAETLLKTAGLAHDEARQLTESQNRYFNEAFEEYNRGEGFEMFASVFSGDPSFVLSGGTVLGRGWMVNEFEGDLEAGMKLNITNIFASKDITVIEGDYENPRENLFRCPPAISMIGFYYDGRIDRMHLHFASHPDQEVEGAYQEP